METIQQEPQKKSERDLHKDDPIMFCIENEFPGKTEQSEPKINLDQKEEQHNTVSDAKDKLDKEQNKVEMVSDSLDTTVVPISDDSELKDVKGRVIYIYMQPQTGFQPNKKPVETYMAMGGDDDSDGGDRKEFTTKVFGLCAVMLIVVVICLLVSHNMHPIKRFFRTKMALVIFGVCAVGLLVVGYAVAYPCARKFPVDAYIACSATVLESYVCCYLASRYAPYIVIGAALVTLLITLACLGLACTNFDFTRFILIVMMALLAVALASIIVVVIRLVFGIPLTILRMVLLVISAVISSVMLIIEFQMILGGKSIELEEDEWILGAYMLFTSILSIFRIMMKLIGWGGGDGDF